MSLYLCWACGMTPLASQVFLDGGGFEMTYSHNCPVQRQHEQKIHEARALAAKVADRMATMELQLREAREAVQELLGTNPWIGGQCGQSIEQPCTWSTPCMFHRVAALAKMPVLDVIDAEVEFENTTFHAVLDANTCPACRETDGQEGKPVPHPGCTNPNGCRCTASVP